MSLKKRIQVPFREPLFLGKWYGVATYFSLYKEIKKNTNYKIHDWIVPFIDWIKITYLEKRENYIVLNPSYILPNNYIVYCPSYILPKINEDKARSTKPKT